MTSQHCSHVDWHATGSVRNSGHACEVTNPWYRNHLASDEAHRVWEWNGVCLRARPVPTERWLARQLYHSWYFGENPSQGALRPTRRAA